jgi:hypothetical protein
MLMGTDYETRLTAFAEGKRLARLSKVVRERGVCDACGSTLPHLLFGVRDTVTGRHFFLGQNCLALLLERRLIARARYRESAEVAYRREMELRRHTGIADIPDTMTEKNVVRIAGPPRSPKTKERVAAARPARVDGLPVNHPLSELRTVLDSHPRFEWVREDSALVLHQVIEPGDTDLEAFFRAAYKLARDHLLAEGYRSSPKRVSG